MIIDEVRGNYLVDIRLLYNSTTGKKLHISKGIYAYHQFDFKCGDALANKTKENKWRVIINLN